MTGVKLNAIYDSRPTVNKNFYIADGYRLLKVDTLDNRSIGDKVAGTIARYLKQPSEAVVFSDFRHGIFNRQTIPLFCDAIPALSFKAADSQVASRWGNILEFQGFDLITPNEREARFSLGDQDSVIRPLAMQLYQKARCKTLILKLGERGSLTYRNDSESDPHAFFILDSFADRMVDAVGSGDALLAYATLGTMATGNQVAGSVIGNLAAGIACGVEGNIPIAQEKIREKIDELERKVNFETA
jgi:bifunctional ADP-heptose synthase (sugar kinase/adenylyltransferase)